MQLRTRAVLVEEPGGPRRELRDFGSLFEENRSKLSSARFPPEETIVIPSSGGDDRDRFVVRQDGSDLQQITDTTDVAGFISDGPP